jgi:ABC-type oligopeptide transport system substrate-binding subunit
MSGYLLHSVVDLSSQHRVLEPTTMAFDAGFFMEKFKAFVQPIFDKYKVRMLEIVAEKDLEVRIEPTESLRFQLNLVCSILEILDSDHWK